MAGFVHLGRAMRSQLFLAGRGIDTQFHITQHLSDVFAQTVEHGFKHVEGFTLILVQRIALTISPQADALTQMVQIEQLLLPGLVEHLQQ